MQEAHATSQPGPIGHRRPVWLNDALADRWSIGTKLVTASTASFAAAVLTAGLILSWRWQESRPFSPSDDVTGPSVWSVLVWGLMIAAVSLRIVGWWRIASVNPLMDAGHLRPVAWRFCNALGLMAAVAIALAVITSPGESPSPAQAAIAGLIRLGAFACIAGHAICGWSHVAGIAQRLGAAGVARSACVLTAIAAAGTLVSLFLFIRAALYVPSNTDTASIATLIALVVALCSVMLTLVMEHGMLAGFARVVRPRSVTLYNV